MPLCQQDRLRRVYRALTNRRDAVSVFSVTNLRPRIARPLFPATRRRQSLAKLPTSFAPAHAVTSPALIANWLGYAGEKLPTFF